MDRERIVRALDRSRIPSYMHGAMLRWIFQGIPPGGFLQAILSNDLKEACARADDANLDLIPHYVGFLWSWAPLGCWGSPEAVREWAARYQTSDTNQQTPDTNHHPTAKDQIND